MTDRLLRSSEAVADLRALRAFTRNTWARAVGGRLGDRIRALRTDHTRIPLMFTITNEDIR